MTEPITRHVPGTWMALVTARAWLLVDGGSSGGFAFACVKDDMTRVVVRGPAVAEITGADGGVRVVRQEDGSQNLPGVAIGVRLASSIDGVRGDASALPGESGVFTASMVEYVDEAAVRERVVERDSDEAFLDDFMEPAGGRTQIVEASDLDWMSGPSQPPVSAPEPTPPSKPEPEPEREPEPEPELPPAPPIPELMPPTPEQTLAAPLPPLPDPVIPPPPPMPPLPAQPPSLFGATDQPLVTALRCPSGHLTSTESIFCRVCRAAVSSQEPVTVARPCLGRLRLSNGEVYLLDRDAVFGRKPEIPAGRPGPRPNAIALTDDQDVSRNHVEIRLDGWRVLALDLGSMNGTQLVGPNLAPRLLPPGTAQEIVPGSVLTLAPDVWIYFEDER